MTVMETMNDTKRPLPDGWRWVQLGEVCEIRMGETLIQRDLTGDGIPVFSANTSAEPWGYTTHGRLVFEETSIVVGARGSIGFPRWPNLPQWTATQTTIVLTCRNSEVMTAAWLLRALQCVDFKIMTAQQAIPMMTVADIELLEIPIPPLHEQKRIAGVLREQMVTVEKARTAAQTRLEAVKALPAAFLRQVFPQPGQPLPTGWRRVRLGEIASYGPDNGIFKRRGDFGKGVPIVNVSDLFRSLHVDLSLTERVCVTGDELKRYEIVPGDLFFCRSSLKREGIGWCCVIKEMEEPAVFECHVMRVRLKLMDAIPEYVAHYWSHPAVREKVIGNSRTATMTTMNQQDLAGVMIPLPPLPEQQHIVDLLQEQMAMLEKARAAVQEELNTINALPAALLRRAFAGEL